MEDSDFEILIKYVQSNDNIVQLEKRIRAMIQGGKCEKGDLYFIRDTYLNGNVDLTVYILTRLNLLYSNADAQEFERLREQYEQKIDKYLERLNKLEESRTKKNPSDGITEGVIRSEER